MAVRFTRAEMLMLANTARPHQTRFTSACASILAHKVARSQTRVTRVFAQVLGTQHPSEANNLKFTTAYLQVLSHWTPVFDWIDMFVYEEFPFDISYNSISATNFATDVVVTDSGDDQRTSRWDQPLMEYDVAYGVRTMEQLHGLIAFFRAMKGKAYGFLYKDPVDYTSTLALRVEARSAPPVTPLDQVIGTGDASTYVFQMKKAYPTVGGLTHTRTITKPNALTVRCAINGTEITRFTVDATTGKITLTPAVTLNGLPNLTLTKPDAGHAQIVGSGACFATLVPYVGKRLVMYGWINAANNFGIGDNVLISSISGDNNTMVVTMPSGNRGVFESNSAAVRMYTHPAPYVGDVLTCGFEFWVPVRFDTDRLPVNLEEYGVGSATDVKLIEIRPGEAL